jgi:hypothetical protein
MQRYGWKTLTVELFASHFLLLSLALVIRQLGVVACLSGLLQLIVMGQLWQLDFVPLDFGQVAAQVPQGTIERVGLLLQR